MTAAAFYSDAAFFARLRRSGAANLAQFTRDMSERAALIGGWCGCTDCANDPVVAIQQGGGAF